jgi:DNA-binding response OmpR family regulator
MGLEHQPTLVLALGNEDASSTMAGILWLKGCVVFKSNSASDCLAQINGLHGKVDVLVVCSEIALDRNAMLIINIKKMQLNTKVLVIGEENSDKTRILDYGADEFALKPMSPENTADKILMLLARDKVAENRAE